MNLYVHTALLLLLLVVPVTHITGQLPGYPARKFTAEHGLQYNIVKVVQDADGFTWLMYPDEIQRFDGKNTETWFKGETIHWLFIDSRENIWVTTRKGIFQFDARTRRFIEIASEATTSSSKLIFESGEGQLRYISASGIYSYDEVSNQFILSNETSHQLKPGAGVSYRRFSSVNNTLYYFVKDTIWRHDIKTGKADNIPVRELRSILALSEQEIIVSTWEHKSWYYNFSTRQQLRLSMPGEDSFLFVFDATAVGKNMHYLATSKGLAAYRAGTDSLQRLQLSFDGKLLPVQEYKGLYKGKEGIVWACTPSSLLGFNPFDENINFIQKNVTAPAYWSSHNVRNFAEDEKGNLWLATIDGVTYWDIENNRFSTILAEENASDRLNHASIRGLVYDGTHLIIGQTNKGIWLYHPKTKTFKRPVFKNDENGRLLKKKIERAFIRQIKTLKNGDHIVVTHGGIYLITRDNYTIEAIDLPEARSRKHFSYQDRKGNIFIGTQNGLYCLDASLRYQYMVKEELETPILYSMLEQDNGYYLGTAKGLCFFSKNNDTIVVKKVIPGLQDQLIRILFEDANNTIWILTERKMYQYFPETELLKAYGYSENLRGDFFHANSYIRKRNGQVFIGATNGIHYFYPEKINPYPEKLYPYIKEINIQEFADSIDSFEKPRHLKRHQNTIEMRFSVPYYGNPDDITYRYQLTKNGEWFNLGNQSGLTLWGLPPGNYRFRMASTLSDGVWHTSRDSFRFTIPPPFWKTWWFTLGMIVLGCTILYRIFISFQRKLKAEKLLGAFATSLYGHNTVNAILWDTAGNCVQKLAFTNCIIYEVDKKKNVLLQKATADSKNPYNREIINVMEIPLNKGIAGTVAGSGKAVRVKNIVKTPWHIAGSEKTGSEIAVPILIAGEVFGVIYSKHPKRNFYTHYHVRLLEKIAALCADRIRKYLTEEKLRGKIARDLHDEMGSTLTSIHIISKMSEQKLQENAPLKKQLTRINDHTSDMIEKMSDMVWVVNPANDDLDKLMYKIREYAEEVLESKNIGISFLEIENAQHIKLNPEQRKNIYLIAKETLNNAVKYSDATRVMILFKEESNTLKMQISDNGKGYDPSVSHSGNGLKNMYVRAQEINAVLEVETTAGEGVWLLLSLAIERKQPVE